MHVPVCLPVEKEVVLVAELNAGCVHNKVAWGHCAFLHCPNYREHCPAHALTLAGDKCNRVVRTFLLSIPIMDKGSAEALMKYCADNGISYIELGGAIPPYENPR